MGIRGVGRALVFRCLLLVIIGGVRSDGLGVSSVLGRLREEESSTVSGRTRVRDTSPAWVGAVPFSDKQYGE